MLAPFTLLALLTAAPPPAENAPLPPAARRLVVPAAKTALAAKSTPVETPGPLAALPAPIAGFTVAPRLVQVYETPYYDCYSLDRKWLDCYPSFHERHYRRPYNYRVLFDYPWHEEPNRGAGYSNTVDDCPTAEESPAGVTSARLPRSAPGATRR